MVSVYFIMLWQNWYKTEWCDIMLYKAVHVDYEFLNDLITKLDMLLWLVRKLLEFITDRASECSGLLLPERKK